MDVRPARDIVTSARSLRQRAIARASVVPPRINMDGFMSSANPLDAHFASANRWLSIVGIGEDGIDGLTASARGLIQSATVVFGGNRHLALAAPLIRGATQAWPRPFEQS